MTVDFRDYFWGEKNNGFDVLYHNMKYGLVASKELVEFLRERSNIEENNWKLVTKLAKQASNSCSQGTFAPLWSLLRNTAERLATLHLQMVQKVGDLVKDVSKYTDELHKKHKTVKEEEGGTLEVVQAIQSTSLTLQKARDAFTQKNIELDKLKKECASPRELEKAEQKLKKAQDEYKALVDKYGSIKEEFEKKMSLSCKHFQEVEEGHLRQMKEFITTYAELIENNHDLMGQVHLDFKRQCIEMTVEKLLEQFVLNKYTGLEKPGVMELDGALETLGVGDPGKGAPSTPMSCPPTAQPTALKREGREHSVSSATSAPTSPLPPDPTTISRHPLRGSKWFLRSRRDKKKEKKVKKKKEMTCDNMSNKEEKSDIEEKEELPKSTTPTPEVDEEGYCVRPKVESWEMDATGCSFYSSSDTDSDEEREKKIRVEIKPISNGAGPMSASVDELRATVESFSLSPLGNVLTKRGVSGNNQMKRSQSVSQQIGGKSTSDLTGTMVQSPTGSSASTPTGNHPYAPLQSPTPPISSTSNRYSDARDLFADIGDSLGPSSKQGPISSSVSASTIIIPRPPSRRSEGGIRSPVPGNLGQNDSVEFRASGIPVGSSRGPSPLTLGMADTIPLAIAFHEIIHSYFRGTDEDRCQVKLFGDMMVSFPAGIVNILTTNPNPAQLSFKIGNSSNLDNVLPNKQLINADSVQTSKEGNVYEFNMSALTSLLKRQSEQNPSASYFNVDILKYQIVSKPGAESSPLHLVSYWKREKTQTNLKIDYKYNSHAMSSPSPLLNVSIGVNIDGGVTNMQTKPSAHWFEESGGAVWRFTELSQLSEKHGVGSLRGRFEVTNGPSTLATVVAHFDCERATLSGIDFQLLGHGYRISLIKKRFVSGKYICEGYDADSKFRYCTPSAIES